MRSTLQIKEINLLHYISSYYSRLQVREFSKHTKSHPQYKPYSGHYEEYKPQSFTKGLGEIHSGVDMLDVKYLSKAYAHIPLPATKSGKLNSSWCTVHLLPRTTADTTA